MTSAMVLAGNGASAAGPARALYIEGDNVLKGAGGNTFGVPESSIVVTERGPGGVSSMTFTLRDPGKVHTLAEGDDVLYYDLVNGRPEFLGWIQGWGVERFGLGRAFTVRCIGVEAVLDWLIVPSLSLPALTTLRDAIQAAAAVAVGIGVPLRALSSPGFAVYDVQGSQDAPIARFVAENLITITLQTQVDITAKTLRETLAAIFASTLPWFGTAATEFLGVATVDFYWGLRCYRPELGPSDYAALTVADTAAAALAPENLKHNVDSGGRPRQAYVVGGNAAGTGMVPDGTGLAGPTAVITDATILTDDAKRNAARAYLKDKASTIRGSFELNGNTITTNVRAGSILGLTDSETGATGSYAIAEIVRTYQGARRSWRISFGGLPLTLSRQVRRLTRGTLS